MASEAAAGLRRELNAAGLRADPDQVRLLTVLRHAQETHLRAGEVEFLVAAAGGRPAPGAVAALLESFATHGLVGRILLPNGEVVFDTVAECHSHLIDEERGEIVDLHVSPETLAAIVAQTIALHGRRVGVMLRIGRAGDAAAATRASPLAGNPRV